MNRDYLAYYGRFAAGVGFRVGGVFVSLASVIITSRGLGVDGRGLFFTCTSAAQVAAQFLALGMPSAVVLVVAPQPALARRAVLRALAAALGAGVAALIITGLLFRLLPLSWLSPEVIELSPFVAAMVATQILLWWSSSLTQALGAVDRIPLIELIYRLFSVCWAGTALFILKFSFVAFLGGMVAVDALCGGLWLLYVRSLSPQSNAVPSWPGNWTRLSLKAYFPLTLYSGMRRADALLLTSIAGVGATGLYSIAAQVMDMCQIAPVFLGQKAMYAFSAGHGDNPSMRWLRRLIPIMVACAMVAAGATAEMWATAFLGRDFSGVGPIIIALALGGGALAWETVAVQEVNAAGFPLLLTIAWLACLGLAVGLMVLMIPLFGAVGAALAVSLSYTVLAVMVQRLRHRIRRQAVDAVRQCCA